MLRRPQGQNTNQIKLANFLLTRLGLELRWRMGKRMIGSCVGRQRVKKKKWFNLAVALLRLSRRGKAPFSISLSALIKLSFWGGVRVAVWDDRSWGDKWYPCSGEAACTDVAESRDISSSCRSWNRTGEGVWLETGGMDGFLSPSVHAAFSVRWECAVADAALMDYRCL